MSAEVQKCDSCGQEVCVVFTTAPMHPLYCMSCYDEQIADPEVDEEEDDYDPPFEESSYE